jgi:uncharacterized protein (DUF1778 family)
MENEESSIKTKVKQDGEFVWPIETRREFTAFKLTKTERERLNRAAKTKGLSISEFIRQAIEKTLSGVVNDRHNEALENGI